MKTTTRHTPRATRTHRYDLTPALPRTPVTLAVVYVALVVAGVAAVGLGAAYVATALPGGLAGLLAGWTLTVGAMASVPAAAARVLRAVA